MLKSLSERKFPFEEFVFNGDQGRGVYRFDLYPQASGFYMERILEIFRDELTGPEPPASTPGSDR